MNYHIIPKNFVDISKIDINLQLTNDKLKSFISHSLFFYLNDIQKQLQKIQKNNSELSFEYINRIINPFENIYSVLPSLLNNSNPETSIFFELLELLQLFNIGELVDKKQQINAAYLTNNYSSILQLINIVREYNDDTTISSDFNYNFLFHLFINNNFKYNIDLFICEFYPDDYTNTNKYIKNMLLVLLIAIKHQSNNGLCIIKIDGIFFKAIVDIIFILSTLYDKLYLVKPTIINISKGDKYLICKGFNSDKTLSTETLQKKIADILNSYDDNDNKQNIYSIMNNEIPAFFLNKLEESNIIIGQQQIETYDQIINIFKHKNCDDKLDILKKNYIQKYIQFYEKNYLPYNKNIDKVNIFLQT